MKPADLDLGPGSGLKAFERALNIPCHMQSEYHWNFQLSLDSRC